MIYSQRCVLHHVISSVSGVCFMVNDFTSDSGNLLENVSGSVDLRRGAGRGRAQDGGPAVPLPPAAQDDEEGTAEGLVEEGVEDGVQHGVDVAQPQAGGPQLAGHGVVYKGVHHVGDEERRPAEAEAAHDDAQGLCRLGFSSHAVVPLMVGRVPRPPRPLQHADLQGVCPGRDVDPLVGQHHEDQGDVEGHHRAGEGVRLVDHEDAGRGVAGVAVAPLLNLTTQRTVRWFNTHVSTEVTDFEDS